MKVYVFRGQGRVFGFTNNEAGLNLPAGYGPWTEFKTLEMSRGVEAGRAVNTEDCLNDIQEYGFHLTDAHVRITEQVTKLAKSS